MRSSRGFSLVELMVTLVILGLILALGMPAMRDWLANNRLRAVAGSIVDGLNFARAEALSQNALVCFTLSERGVGSGRSDGNWFVGLPRDANTVCDSVIRRGGAELSQPDIAVSTNFMIFNGLGRVIKPTEAVKMKIDVQSMSSANTDACLSATNRNGLRCLQVVVSFSGQVRMCDPAVTDTTDPRHC